jgi:peptide/nickel transport system permease protein
LKLLKRRILLALVAFAVTVNLNFFLPRLIPGSAAQVFASRSYLPAREVEIISARLGLNQPLPVQYFLYLKGIFYDWPPYFGVSYQYYPEPVTTLVASRIPWTMMLIVTSLVLSMVISFIMAGISSMRRQGKFEISTMYISIMFWSIPTFWVGMVLIWVFAVTLGWFPVFGNTSFQAGTGLNYIANVLWHAVLPVATLTLAVFAQGYVVLRGATQEALKADYVIAAKCRGLRQSVVAFGYIVRNSLLPVVALLGYSLGSLISFAIVIEAVFGYQGVGDLFVDGLYNRDYPVLAGSFFYTTLLVIIGGVLADYLITQLDPRVR